MYPVKNEGAEVIFSCDLKATEGFPLLRNRPRKDEVECGG